MQMLGHEVGWVQLRVALDQRQASADRLLLNSTGDAFVEDQFGNARGGIRTPYVDVPVARFSGFGQGDDGRSQFGSIRT